MRRNQYGLHRRIKTMEKQVRETPDPNGVELGEIPEFLARLPTPILRFLAEEPDEEVKQLSDAELDARLDEMLRENLECGEIQRTPDGLWVVGEEAEFPDLAEATVAFLNEAERRLAENQA